MKRSAITGAAACLVLVAATLAALSPTDGHAQPAGIGISLTPATASNNVGTSHTVTASVHDLTAGINSFGAGAALTFTVTLGPNTGETGQGTTNADGQVAFTYTSNGTPGIDTIEACPQIQDPNLEIFCGTAIKAWGVPLPPATPTPTPLLVLTPMTASNPVGTSHTVTATFPNTPGAGVFFIVTAGPNAGPGGYGKTDANGEVSITYTSNGTPGTDTIEACVFPTTCATASKTWEQPQQKLSGQTPTPTPTLTPTPTSTPTPTATPTPIGGNPAAGGSGFPWWALAIAAAIGVVGGLGLALARWRIRTR